MKVIHQRKECIGCGSCVVVCPRFWKMAEDGKSELLNARFDPKRQEAVLEIADPGCMLEAAEICPVQCIKIKK